MTRRIARGAADDPQEVPSFLQIQRREFERCAEECQDECVVVMGSGAATNLRRGVRCALLDIDGAFIDEAFVDEWRRSLWNACIECYLTATV